MNVIFARSEHRKHRLLRELNKRLLRAEQSRRGYFDDDGVLQGGLMAFIRYYWHVLEPETELAEGWALYAIVLHLEAVTFGEIKRLLMTVPPGFMKSLCTDVFWPAWEWGPMDLAHLRYVAFSYSASLTERDNNRFRDLVLHSSYKELWGDRVSVVQAGSVKISNTKKGWKLASSVGGVGTGERGDRLICFPRETRIFTDKGWLAIGDIVELNLKVRVAGYDDECDNIVWQEIEAYEHNPGSELVEVEHECGSFRCTPDHPVFVYGRGYTQAAQIRQGDALCVLRDNDYRQAKCEAEILLETVPERGGTARGENCEQPTVQGVWNYGVSPSYAFSADAKRFVLQPSLPRYCEPRAKQSSLYDRCEDIALSMVRQRTCPSSQRGKESGMLFRLLRKLTQMVAFGKKTIRKTVCLLRRTIQATAQKAFVLLGEMCRLVAFNEDEGCGEWALCPRGGCQRLSTWLDQGTQRGYTRTRRIRLLSLWHGAENTSVECTSYRLSEGQSEPDEPDYSVQGLSREYARWNVSAQNVDKSTVQSIRKVGKVAKTFNVCVSPCHNYFAEGVLVHNCDDPNNIKEAESEIVRDETNRWFRESMSDRLNDLTTGVIVVIMQRAHENDVAGTILTLQLPYCHLMIPMEYDWERQVDDDGEPRKTEIGWYDPRYVAGDPDACNKMLAWPERFPEEVVADMRTVKGPYAWAGQYLQSPAPRGGGIFKRAWWQVWDSPDGKFPAVEYILASLDSAFTEKESNSPSALTIWGVFIEPNVQRRRIILLHAWRKFLEFSGPRIEPLATTRKIDGVEWAPEIPLVGDSERVSKWKRENFRRRTMDKWGLVEWVADTCDRFKVDKLLIEAKASGMPAAEELTHRYPDRQWSIELQPVCGDKYSRALAVQPTFSQLLVFSPIRDWSEMVIEEMESFPKHTYKDLTDSTSQALRYLRDIGLANTDKEAVAEEMQRVMHRPKPTALYPV